MGKNRKTPHISLDDSEMGIWNRSMELDDDDYSEDEVFKETAYSDGIERLELLAETPAGRFPYYEDYLTASKEQRKKERKRRKKLFPIEEDVVEEIYDSLGGKEEVKKFANSLQAYVTDIVNFLILEQTPAHILLMVRNILFQGTEDFAKGVPWILDPESFMEYTNEMNEPLPFK